MRKRFASMPFAAAGYECHGGEVYACTVSVLNFSGKHDDYTFFREVQSLRFTAITYHGLEGAVGLAEPGLWLSV